MSPLISVIIPAHHRPESLNKAINSVITQTYGYFELIVVDDGKTLPESFQSNIISNRKTHFIQTEHFGVAHARNTGIKASSGEFIAFLDSDDYWLPEKLAAQARLLNNDPVLKVAQNREIWVRNGRRVNPCKQHIMKAGDLFEDSLRMCVLSPSSVILHRDVLETCGLFDPLLTVCEDYELWLRVTSKYTAGLVDDMLTVKHGGHQDQLSRTFPAMDRYRVYSILKLLLKSELSENQRTPAVEELKRKATILKKGAIKRGLLVELKLYEEIEKFCLTYTSDFNLGETLLARTVELLEKPQDY